MTKTPRYNITLDTDAMAEAKALASESAAKREGVGDMQQALVRSENETPSYLVRENLEEGVDVFWQVHNDCVASFTVHRIARFDLRVMAIGPYDADHHQRDLDAVAERGRQRWKDTGMSRTDV